MDISAVSAPPPVHVKTPDASTVKTPDASEVKPADVQSGAAADGTRLPQPTPRAPPAPRTGNELYAGGQSWTVDCRRNPLARLGFVDSVVHRSPSRSTPTAGTFTGH